MKLVALALLPNKTGPPPPPSVSPKQKHPGSKPKFLVNKVTHAVFISEEKG